MGRNTVHIQRHGEYRVVRVLYLLQNARVIRRNAQLFLFPFSAEKNARHGYDEAGSAHPLFGAAVDQYRLHASVASASSFVAKNSTCCSA